MKYLVEYFKFLLSTLLGLSAPLVLIALVAYFTENTTDAFSVSFVVFFFGLFFALPASFFWFLFYQIIKSKYGSNFQNLFFSGIATIFLIGSAKGFSSTNMYGALPTMFLLCLPFGITSALIYSFLFERNSHNK